MLYPLKFYPLFKEKPWGGNLIKTYLHKQSINAVDFDNIGESWDICDRYEDQSIVINGALKGKTLEELRLEYKEQLVGNKIDYNKRFPLLVKILDAKEDLSLQVHPAIVNLPQLPANAETKTEFWYILKNQPHAKIIAGLKNYSQAEFTANIHNRNLIDFVKVYDSAKNRFFFIKSGTIHAIGSGNLLIEIQQNSDTTYRISDWGKVDKNGNSRELHIKESLQCINFNKDNDIIMQDVITNKNYTLLDNNLFTVKTYNIYQKEIKATPKNNCEIISITCGCLQIICRQEILTLNTGESALLPPNLNLELLPLKSKVNFLITTTK